ncbi:thioredoxin domain-containing protein [Ureibacillus sp. NPDC094379]
MKIGNELADVKLEVFVNASCPACAKLYQTSKGIIKEYIQKDQLQLIVKLWDKPRKTLLHGTRIHLSVDYSSPKETLRIIGSLLETQSEWKPLSDQELENLLTEKYQLEERPENTDISLAITQEAFERQVKYLPTLFINNELQSLKPDYDQATIKSLIEDGLKTKVNE